MGWKCETHDEKTNVCSEALEMRQELGGPYCEIKLLLTRNSLNIVYELEKYGLGRNSVAYCYEPGG